MSRPRKPYGPNPPGRLLGTMIKVLAAGSRRQEHAFWERAGFIHLDAGHHALDRGGDE